MLILIKLTAQKSVLKVAVGKNDDLLIRPSTLYAVFGDRYTNSYIGIIGDYGIVVTGKACKLKGPF